MTDKMTTVQQILADEALIPWIEQRALDYVRQRFVMASRVLTLGDMTGWNTRKVSENRAPGRASQLDEGVDIPSKNKWLRKRLAEIDPKEWGDVYELTNRRTSTDPEQVLADVVGGLGYSLGREKENAIFDTILDNANSQIVVSAPTSPYTTDLAVQLQTVFEAKAWSDGGQIYHVIHPFQELDVKLELIKLTNAAVPDFRNQFIRQWSYGGFGNLNIAVSGMTPRKVLHRIVFPGSPVNGETFRLRFGLIDTANIAVGANAAATVTAIQSALDTVASGAYTVTGSAYSNIRAQSLHFLDEESQLVKGLDDDGDVVDNATGGFRVEEVSGVARAPFFQSVGVVNDIRQAVGVYTFWFPRARTLEIGATEVYGVGAWKQERLGYIESDATSPTAVASP